MTALVIPPEQILADIARLTHDEVTAGTLDGYNWHRSIGTTPCLPCRAAHNEDRCRRARHPEYQRLLDAGVNRATALYLSRVTRNRGLSTAPFTSVHSATDRAA